MKYVVYYESADNIMERVMPLIPAHEEHWHKYRDGGTLLMVGPFADRSGALSIFTTREAAEDFAKNDPFVTGGAVKSWNIREWNEVIVP
jgi:uncharacterized protein